jgi:hypothetical protein
MLQLFQKFCLLGIKFRLGNYFGIEKFLQLL